MNQRKAIRLKPLVRPTHALYTFFSAPASSPPITGVARDQLYKFMKSGLETLLRDEV